MQQILIFLLIIFGLNSCNQIKKSEDKEATNTIVGISTDKAPSSNKLIANAMLDCFIFKFKTAKQQADTLVKYFGKNQLTTDEKFFCAFPESFKGMENIFGFDENKGAAPLYYYPNVGNMIGYFANLNSISKKNILRKIY